MRLAALAWLAILGVFILAPSAPAQVQAPAPPSPTTPPPRSTSPLKEPGLPPARTNAWKIRNAMSAAPRAIAKDATIMDWATKEGGEPMLLRKGSNDWTCLPDDPKTPGNDPMCLDKNALAWAQAWMTKKEPKLTQPGIGYMLQGGSDASNTDPFATQPASGEKWMSAPPHLMIFPAGKLDPNVYKTDPHQGGPWIMWAGTPYEHLMVPVK